MRYHRTPPQKSFFAYIIPFLILISLGLIVFMLVRFWHNVGDRSGSETSYAYMQTLEGEAKVMLWGTTDWTSVPKSTIKLFKGDSIRALPGGKVKISLFDKHDLVLNGDSELVISELRKENQTLHTALTLNKGEAWINVNRDINPNSTFLIQTESFQAQTKGATLDVEPNIVRVIKGAVEAEIYSQGETLEKIQIGVGQEMVLTDAKIQSFAKQEAVELIGMLSDEFKLSNWYLFNAEGKTVGSTENPEEELLELEAELTETGSSAIEKEEEVATTKIEKPLITVPAKDGAEFTVTGTKQRIEGTVGKDVAKVVVNNYTLQSFKSGSTSWFYNADVNLGNLKKGKNVYEIYAEDAKGNKSEMAKITLIYGSVSVPQSGTTPDKEVAEEKVVEPVVKEEVKTTTETEEKVDTGEETTTDSAEVTGELKITAPNGGENLTTTETHFVISGTAPSNAAKIVVSGYTLTSFTKGNTTWRYTADPQYNNLTVGESNTYKAIAYDADGKVIGSDSIVITVQKTATTEATTGTGTSE